MEKQFKDLLTKARKHLDITTKAEKALILDGCSKMEVMAKEMSRKYSDEEWKRKKERDSKCPLCRKQNIVNRISRVEGSGYVSGSFMLGTGGLYGRSSIDTNEVNHCNDCGNEWKKYKTDYKLSDAFIKQWIIDLGYAFDGKYSFGDYVFELLKDIPAESIWVERKKIYDDLFGGSKAMTLSFIRSKFKSVYDIATKN